MSVRLAELAPKEVEKGRGSDYKVRSRKGREWARTRRPGAET